MLESIAFLALWMVVAIQVLQNKRLHTEVAHMRRDLNRIRWQNSGSNQSDASRWISQMLSV